MARITHFLNVLFRARIALLTGFFVLVVGFLDDRSFYHVLLLMHENSELRQEIATYEAQYAADAQALRLLETSQEAVEKVARVNLLMKTANEDVYVVVEE